MSALTPREAHIMYLLCAGIPPSEIAELCGISRLTVYGHLESIYKRWNVHSRTQAVLMAFHLGVVTVEDAYSMMRGYFEERETP